MTVLAVELEDLIDQLRIGAAGRYGDPWRSYPVLVDLVDTRLLWIEAESQEDAIKFAENDGDLYELFDGSESVDGSWNVNPFQPDPYFYDHSRRIGPRRETTVGLNFRYDEF